MTPVPGTPTPGNQQNSSPFDDTPVIFSYSRRQGIEDGVLVDLTNWAKELGFSIPVACTDAVWNGYVVPSEELRGLGQSERGRGHDLLWNLLCAIRRQPEAVDQLLYKVIFLQTGGRQETIELKAVCGPGDNGDPVLTILLPAED